METRFANELAFALAEYRAARVVGTGFLAIGLTLTTIGSFVA